MTGTWRCEDGVLGRGGMDMDPIHGRQATALGLVAKATNKPDASVSTAPSVASQEGSQRLQALGGRGRKAVLAAAAGHDDAVQRCTGLVAAVRPPKLQPSQVSRRRATSEVPTAMV